jgi:hypothetical protein
MVQPADLRKFNYLSHLRRLDGPRNRCIFRQTRSFKDSTRELQADINDALLETIHKSELKDWAEFGKIRAAYEKKLKDPDDVFLDAEERKEELRQKSKVRFQFLRRTGIDSNPSAIVDVNASCVPDTVIRGICFDRNTEILFRHGRGQELESFRAYHLSH